MSLVGSGLGAVISSNLFSAGAFGSNRTKFSLALGQGIVNGIVGAAFTTADSGTGTGGTGTGTGITGLVDADMTNAALAAMTSQGTNARPMMDAIMRAVKSYIAANTSLASTDPAVGVGSGTIVVGSIAVTTAGMKALIKAALIAQSANGSNVDNLSFAVATGVCDAGILATGTGSVVISGGSGVPPTSGAGSGVAS